MSLFWSMRPFEEVMKNAEEAEQLEELRIQDITMLVSNLGESVRIERIMSPRPNDYLNPAWQPGRVLHRSQL